MKYCIHCGNELLDEAIICPKCGCSVNYTTKKTVVNNGAKTETSTLKTIAKVFMIISTVILGFYIIPLAWCLPMTITYCNKIKNGEPVSTGFKICALLFVNTLAGILMLCDKEQ